MVMAPGTIGGGDLGTTTFKLEVQGNSLVYKPTNPSSYYKPITVGTLMNGYWVINPNYSVLNGTPLLAGAIGSTPVMISGVRYNSAGQQINQSGVPLTDATTNEFQKYYNEAKQANEKRYNQAVALFQDPLDPSKGLIPETNAALTGYGTQQAADINQLWANTQSQGMQDLTSKGLMNSSVAPTMKMGYARQKSADLSRLQESIQQQKAAYNIDLTKSLAGIIGSRTDTYPDLMQAYILSQGVGKSTATGAG